jgi:hypothetical protein
MAGNFDRSCAQKRRATGKREVSVSREGELVIVVVLSDPINSRHMYPSECISCICILCTIVIIKQRNNGECAGYK